MHWQWNRHGEFRQNERLDGTLDSGFSAGAVVRISQPYPSFFDKVSHGPA
jgi:hypothetical protein